MREQTGEQRLALIGAGRCMARPHARQRLAKTLLIERLEQVVDRAHLERLESVGVVGRDEHQRRQLLRRSSARASSMPFSGSIWMSRNKSCGRFARIAASAAVPSAYSPTTRKSLLRLAEFAQRAPSGLLVVDDDDVHHALTNVQRGARRAGRANL